MSSVAHPDFSKSCGCLTAPQELTIPFRLLSGTARTFLLAGLALKVIFSPVKGFTPSRAFVAGFFTTFSFSRPGRVNKPLPRRLFLITPPSESKRSEEHTSELQSRENLVSRL